MQVVEHMYEPLLRVDSDYVAAFEQGVEYGVVDGAFVVFAEEVVFATHYRGALVALYCIVVDLIDAVIGIAAQTRP